MTQKFVIGLNNAWFNGKYGNDLFDSLYSGSEIWHWPYTEPIPSIGGKYPTLTAPALQLRSAAVSVEEIEAFFAQCQGLDVVRVWLHEQLEGLLFDGNLTVTGVSPDLLDRLRLLFQLASKYNVKVYLTLLNAWDGDFNEKFIPPVADRKDIYRQWVIIKKQILRKLLLDPNGYFNRVVAPILASIGSSPALFAIDIMNEPEGLFVVDAPGDGGPTEIPVIQQGIVTKFFDAVALRIHAMAPNVKVSVGCMTPTFAQIFAKQTGIDFADFHVYNTTGLVPDYKPSDYGGKPCFLGEVGYSVPGDDPQLRAQYELPVAQRLVGEAQRKGYFGVLVWGLYDFVKEENRAEMLRQLKNMAAANLPVAPPPAPTNWLIALLRAIRLIR